MFSFVIIYSRWRRRRTGGVLAASALLQLQDWITHVHYIYDAAQGCCCSWLAGVQIKASSHIVFTSFIFSKASFKHKTALLQSKSCFKAPKSTCAPNSADVCRLTELRILSSMERAIPLLLISERHEGPCSALVARRRRRRQRGVDGDGRNCSVRGLAGGGPLSAQKASSLSAASCLPRVGAVAAAVAHGTRRCSMITTTWRHRRSSWESLADTRKPPLVLRLLHCTGWLVVRWGPLLATTQSLLFCTSVLFLCKYITSVRYTNSERIGRGVWACRLSTTAVSPTSRLWRGEARRWLRRARLSAVFCGSR